MENCELMYKKIEQLDLFFVEKELTDQERGEGWAEEKAKDAIESYPLFLKLRAKYPNIELVPTDVIDKVWHSHITHTEMYVRDCNEIFGRYIHHRPTFKKTEEEIQHLREKFKVTQQLMFEEFGQSIDNLRVGYCLEPSPSCCCWKVE